jgi:hypothetical protein
MAYAYSGPEVALSSHRCCITVYPATNSASPLIPLFLNYQTIPISKRPSDCPAIREPEPYGCAPVAVQPKCDTSKMGLQMSRRGARIEMREGSSQRQLDGGVLREGVIRKAL